ncbi:sugar ABC transporter permease [Streptomyces sp. RB6PN25]|uniref:Sugar ABC transporter permease n=1 Tax=Streptomyces humicola TaxID=2953240 RepID=A0ABT1PNL1_9ACTN|nr:sugar ABC transporter permease [Streptomyces humicola]MCQ4079262.1 sugar ABC transporter permease [Streptomyces humicola]
MWAERALTAVFERVGTTADEVGERFPLYAEPGTGRWTTTSRGSWTGGFWAGMLWLRALASGAAHDHEAAAVCSARLAYWVEQDTAARGLVLWYGTAPDAGLRDRAARACLAAYDPALGIVPWGSAFGGERLLARADGVPGLVPLLACAPGGAVAAYRHLVRHLELCLAEEPPRPAWRALPGGGWAAYDEPAPGWSRTVAWLLLGVADGIHCLPPQKRANGLWDAVDRLIGMRLADRTPLIPQQPLDTSAAAIEAVAALKLATLVREGGREDVSRHLTLRAEAILQRLGSVHLSPSGGLIDGCYDAAHGVAVRHELVWGDFFLALGLAIVTGLVGPFAV